jgi:hypothetical protein
MELLKSLWGMFMAQDGELDYWIFLDRKPNPWFKL